MELADLNRNNELSYTELTEMLENTDYEEFGRWVRGRKQKGFREWDTDGEGTIGVKELEVPPSTAFPHSSTAKPMCRTHSLCGHGSMAPSSSYPRRRGRLFNSYTTEHKRRNSGSG
jgi:hypothetical protein